MDGRGRNHETPDCDRGACRLTRPRRLHTDELALVGAALSLYSDLEYLDGDCAFGLHKYDDSQGHHHCSFSDDEYHQDGTGHHHDQN